jgi:[ribosomal protein S5]-alanine N-acetyltransferase
VTPIGVQLRTSRLVLVPIGDADVAALARHWGEAAVARYLWMEQPVTLDAVARVVTTSNRDFARSSYGIWSVRDPGDDSLMGMCGLRQVEDHDWVEILFSLRQRFWRQGLGSESVFAVLDHAFHTLKLPRVVALVDVGNSALLRIARRAGMSLFITEGERTYWETTREKYLSQSARPPAPT